MLVIFLRLLNDKEHWNCLDCFQLCDGDTCVLFWSKSPGFLVGTPPSRTVKRLPSLDHVKVHPSLAYFYGGGLCQE